MIRHARRCRLPAMPVGALPVAMIEPPFFAPLMPPVGVAPLLKAGLPAALRTAIAMPAVAVRADVENDVAVRPAARPLPEIRVLVSHRRRHRRRAG